MMAPHRKARKMTNEEQLLKAVQRQTQTALHVLPAMVNIRNWLEQDTAGKRYDPLKRDAKTVMDALEQIGIDGQAWANPTEPPATGENGSDL